MELDTYQPCPCGSDKKIKFCCSKDLVHELDKALRALDGSQFTQAAELAKRVMEQHGIRPAFLTIQCDAYLASGQLDEAEKTTKKLLEVMPHSPIGLAFQAIFDVAQGKVDDAVDHLQSALENTGDNPAGTLVTAAHFVSRGLMRSGRIVAARTHHNLHMALRTQLEQADDQQIIKEAVDLRATREIATLLRQDMPMEECPAGVPWAGEFAAALNSANRGAWRAALESWQALDKKVPGQPTILKNIAILSGWLGRNEAAARAWTEYAQLPSLSPDDAIEAVALAHLLDFENERDRHDLVEVQFPIHDIDRLLERLLSDKQVTESRLDPAEFADEGQPRPKALLALLHRPKVEFSPELTWQDLPQHFADIVVYGKQTDREACLELYYERDGVHGDPIPALRGIVGQWLGEPTSTRTISEISSVYSQMNRSFEFPRNATAQWALSITEAFRHYAQSTIWPNLPRSVLGGKTPQQAAQDPALRTAVAALVLNLELASDEHPTGAGRFDFDALRLALGLTPRGTYACPEKIDYATPIARWARYDLSSASDHQLLKLSSVMNLTNMHHAQRRLFAEMLKRPALTEGEDGVELRRRLARMSSDPQDALRLLGEATRAATAAGLSPAQCYLDEFGIRLIVGDSRGCERLMNLLTTRHISEPGIREAIYRMFQRYGLIDEQGRPRTPDGDGPHAPQPGPSPAETAGGLWTPDAQASPKPESKLWLPGMD